MEVYKLQLLIQVCSQLLLWGGMIAAIAYFAICIFLFIGQPQFIKNSIKDLLQIFLETIIRLVAKFCKKNYRFITEMKYAVTIQANLIIKFWD